VAPVRAEHRPVLARLGVPVEPTDSARAFQLLHVLLHELGHHHDRMTTRAGRYSCRGEDFAEHYSRRYAERIWGRYLDEFGC
jgi:hypothetical protein